jgi:hypothetical protein
MSGMPEEIRDRSWRPEQALTISDAIGDFLDHMEQLYTRDEVDLPPDPLPLGTGLAPLDRVLGGGLHVGTLTLLEADLGAQADALLYSVARHIEHWTLLDAASVLETVRWLVAGSADVPAVTIAEGSLDERDWAAIAGSIAPLAARDLVLSAAGSMAALEDVVAGGDATVVLVQDIARLGPPVTTVPRLARLAATADVAVLASTRPLGDLPAWALERTERVLVLDRCLGSRASLIRPDRLELLAVAELEVVCLTGTARGD